MTNTTALLVGGVLSGLAMFSAESLPDNNLLSVVASTGAGGGLAYLLLRNWIRNSDAQGKRLAKIEDERVALVRETITATNACTVAVREIAVAIERSNQRQEETCLQVRELVSEMRGKRLSEEKP